jgi:hypothetical protein
MRFKVIKREDAQNKGLYYFFTGKVCKWDHIVPRFTNKGAQYARDTLGLLYAKAGLCYGCVKLMQQSGGMIGKTFDEIMFEWDSSTDDKMVKRIPVLSGTSKIGYKVVDSTLVDIDIYPELSKILWIKDHNDYIKATMSKDNLRRLDVNNLCYYPTHNHILLHRVILGIQDLPTSDVVGDHVDGNKLDNRVSNLRRASHIENSRNCRRSIDNTTGYVGVDYRKNCVNNQYRTRVFRDGHFRFTEYYPTAILAAQAYDTYLRENYPSDFNVYNFPYIGERGKDGVVM